MVVIYICWWKVPCLKRMMLSFENWCCASLRRWNRVALAMGIKRMFPELKIKPVVPAYPFLFLLMNEDHMNTEKEIKPVVHNILGLSPWAPTMGHPNHLLLLFMLPCTKIFRPPPSCDLCFTINFRTAPAFFIFFYLWWSWCKIFFLNDFYLKIY
jgi:hypothetical protein